MNEDVTTENFSDVLLEGEWRIKIKDIGEQVVQMSGRNPATTYCAMAFVMMTLKPIFGNTGTFKLLSFDKKGVIEVEKMGS